MCFWISNLGISKKRFDKEAGSCGRQSAAASLSYLSRLTVMVCTLTSGKALVRLVCAVCRAGGRVVTLWRSSARPERESNLVDSASSHTLVSKIKPCMSKYKHLIL